MKHTTLATTLALLILTACSPFIIQRSEGQQPTPVIEYSTSVPDLGYQPVQIDSLDVEVGVGSPIPVHVLVSGSLPDTCAQIEHVQTQQDGSTFRISASTVPSSAPGCIQDILPFTASIPLNVVNIPAGTYSVEVNGTQTTFQLDTANTSSELATARTPITKDDIQVDDVNVEIGVGSPIPVHAIISGNLPNTCAQLGEIRAHRDGNTFFVRLIASTPAVSNCKADGLPFRLDFPLNIVNLPEGPYEVNVNGATTSFDPRAVPAQTMITLERTACFGACPVYSLTIHGDGTVEYDGRQHVKVTGTQTAQLTTGQVKELVDAFTNADYFDLQDEYTAPISDIPSVITSFAQDGKSKTIKNYGGCMSDSPVKAPQVLCELEIKIDEVTNSAQWVGSSPQ